MGLFSNNSAAKLAEKQERERAQKLTLGKAYIDDAFKVFTPQFFAQRQKDYLASTLPQLGKQYRQQQNQLGFSLARRGLGTSSQALAASRGLQDTLAENQRQLANNALGLSNNLQTNVAAQRNNLYGTLAATLDPDMAATAALGQAQALTAPSPIVPIGQMFADWSQNYLGRMRNQDFQTATDRLPKMHFANAPRGT